MQPPLHGRSPCDHQEAATDTPPHSQASVPAFYPSHPAGHCPDRPKLESGQERVGNLKARHGFDLNWGIRIERAGAVRALNNDAAKLIGSHG
jgi:hypothetical protein